MTFDSLTERNRFIESNLGLVTSRVLRHNKNRFDNDLFQVGALALTVATDRFDKNAGTKFSTYAVKYIDGYIFKHKRYDALIKPCQKNRAWQFEYKEVLSLDVNNNDITSFISILPSCDNVEKEVVENISICNFLNSLSERERMVIELLLKGEKQKNISKVTRINQSNVSRIISKKRKQYEQHYLV